MNRFVSLDILRGMTVVGMILVNNAWSGSPAWLRHAAWDGCTFADLVFPFFLFIVGASTWFSGRKNQHELNKSVSLHILKRTALIFVIGVLLNWFPFTSSWEHLRIPGVLQRIALVYMFASFLCLGLKSYRKIALAGGAILLAYWALLAFTDSLSTSTLGTNIISRLDVLVFDQAHMLRAYGHPFDPEGLLSTIPSIVNAMLGYLAAMFLGSGNKSKSELGRLFLVGVGMILLALLWNEFFPLNKRLWSSSFVLITSGWAIVAWVPLVYLVDIKSKTLWCAFFRPFGANTLLAYILSILLQKIDWLVSFKVGEGKLHFSQWLAGNVFSPLAKGTALYPLLWAITIILICWAVTYPLYKKKIYIKL